MSKALDKYKAGEWNDVEVKLMPDSSAIITLTKEGDSKIYKCRVRNIYQPNEQEVNIDTGKPIAKRDICKAVPKVSEKAKRPVKRQGG